MTKAKQTAAKRAPTQEEREQMDAAKALADSRPKRTFAPKLAVTFVGANKIEIGCPHDEVLGWGDQMMESVGAGSWAVASLAIAGVGLTRATVPINDQADADAEAKRTNDDLSVIAAIQPQSPLETMLAVQMLAAHKASMMLSHGFHAAKTGESQIERGRLMNQTMRTFAAQVEALTKLRSGGKQQVEVRYVYVDARTQTVVTGGGGGGADQISGQPHAPGALGHAPAPGLPVWSEDAGGHVVPIASHSRKAAVPVARREKSRRSAG